MAALTNSTNHAEYLQLEAWEEAAVVRLIVAGDGVETPICSGVLIASDRVLTAGHCVRDATPGGVTVEFVIGDILLLAVHPAGWAIHPSLDLVVMEIEPLAAELGIGSIPTVDAAPPGLGVDADLQLAGFGADQSGQLGSRRFNVERVATLDDAQIAVTADGAAGACAGDSGGPALMRGADGQVWVVGILRGGTASCFGVDRYVRVDAAASWLNEHVPAPGRLQPEGVSRTTPGSKGRCFGEIAVWLAEGVLQSAVCPSDRHCGWDLRATGFRCVETSQDACHGITELGACSQSTSFRCVDGRVVESPCDACGLDCGRSPRTGASVCFAN
jgi:hypothetical protein